MAENDPNTGKVAITADDIEINEQGGVVIRNPNAAKILRDLQALKVRKGLDPRVAGTNDVCGLGC